VVVLWLCMAAWLVRYEAFPDHFTHSLDGYKGLLSRDILLMDSWMKITFKGDPVGYTHTSMDSSESTPLTHCTINNRTDLRVRFLGQPSVITLNASAGLDVDYRLQNFSCILAGASFSADVMGERKKGNTFDVAIKMAGNPPYKASIDLPDDAILYSPMTAMTMKRMKIGEEVRISTMDPITMKKASVVMTAIRKETLTISGEKCETTVLSTDFHGRQFITWVDGLGSVVKQETPLGWTLEKCSSREAYIAFRDSEGGSDILSTVAGLLMSWQM
jgi:hypothetical protein